MAEQDHGRTALITGASSGIGCAIALQLAARRYRLLLVARRTEKLAEVAERCRAAGGEAQFVSLDLADAAAVRDVMPAQLEAFGPVDVLINNAGHNVLRPFADLPEADADALWQVHYFTPVALMRALLPGMLARGRGVVINVGSISTRVQPWGHGVYAAAKSALRSLTLTLHCEHRRSGVRFCVLTPGVVATEFFDRDSYRGLRAMAMRHALPVDRLAAAALALIDRPRPEFVVPRHYRVIDAIQAVAPRIVQDWMANRGRPN